MDRKKEKHWVLAAIGTVAAGAGSLQPISSRYPCQMLPQGVVQSKLLPLPTADQAAAPWPCS